MLVRDRVDCPNQMFNEAKEDEAVQSSDVSDERSHASFGSKCDVCNRSDTSNMTWGDGIKNFFSTYFSAPRMWPLGYILHDAYSPLRLERSFPSHNWRDAFEDLLALEAGRSMIRPSDRIAETRYASNNRYELASRAIAHSNIGLQSLVPIRAEALEGRQEAVRNQQSHIVRYYDDHLLAMHQAEHDRLVLLAQKTRADFEKNRSATASSVKPRGQWIASLINSGVLLGWEWSTSNSVDGPTMHFRRCDAPPEMDTGLVGVSELELEQVFEKDQPYGFVMPAPITEERIKALTDEPNEYNEYDQVVHPDPLRDFYPSRSSIIHQTAHAEPVKLRDGTIGTKVSFRNSLADNTTVTKEFVQEPLKVLEEVENARKYMDMLSRSMITQSKLDRIHRALGETHVLEEAKSQNLSN